LLFYNKQFMWCGVKAAETTISICDTWAKARKGQRYQCTCKDIGCGPLDATNALKYLIDQSEDRILQINQSKNASKHS